MKRVTATVLVGSMLATLASSPAVAESGVPTNLVCRSDGSINEMAIATTPLPARFTRVSGRVRRPVMRDGNFLLRIVLANSAGPPTHAGGLMTRSTPSPEPPRPLELYDLSLFDSADDGRIRNEANGWLVIANEFALSFSIEEPGRLTSRLDWEAPRRGARSHTLSVPTARDDFGHLTIACWNGDFELYDIEVAGG